MLRIDRMRRSTSTAIVVLCALFAFAVASGQERQGGRGGQNFQGRQGGQGGQNWQNRQGGQNFQGRQGGQGGQNWQNRQGGQNFQGRQGGPGGQNFQGRQGGQNWQNRQGGQNFQGRQGGQDGRNRRNGGQGGPGGPGAPGGSSSDRIAQAMTRDRFERLKQNPQWAEGVKARVGAERWAQWERGDFSSSASAADQAAAAAEGRPLDSNLTDEERAAAEALLRTGQVPDFRGGGDAYSLEAENEYYQQALAQRDEALVSATPLSVRAYSRFFVMKYDKNGDGMLQRPEWEDKIEGAQAIDLNGDWTLTDQEIMFYLMRFAKDRTIANPNPSPVVAPRVNAVVENAEEPLLIRTASAAPRLASREELDQERQQTTDEDLAEMSDEDFYKLMTEDNPAMESVDDAEILNVLLIDMDEKTGREFTPSPARMMDVPIWFLARDVNGDGQLTLLEFSPNLLPATIAQFGKLDSDADGLITADEVRQAAKAAKQDAQQ
ncbi:MAG: hypothetical protein IJU03_11065 [Thermoguttaceae bacterium]|nr:hypothetical protein [Thermoguttaceae bacterium]